MRMTDPSNILCPRCGGSRVTRADGLCSTCLLTTALAVDDGPCPYEVLAPIADGRDSVTYLAQGLRGPRAYVALKIHSARADVADAVSRYARLKPTIDRVPDSMAAKLIDVGRTPDGRLYLASQYIAGWPLSAIDAHVTPDDARRIDLARQLLDAVAAAHEAGLAHLALGPTKVKCSTAAGPRATILGLGSSLIIDGAAPSQEPDLTALANLLGTLGVEVPGRAYSSAGDMRTAVLALAPPQTPRRP